jgi:conjugal transfer pilus assembly protein TraI
MWRNLFRPTRESSVTTTRVQADNRDQAPLGPGELLEAHKERVTALRLESGYSAEIFERLMGGPLKSVAEYVYSLPATNGQNHGESAGLLRLAVETACLAFRRADGKFLSSPLPSDVRNRERDRIWRYAIFLAGLLRPLGHCLATVQVNAANSADSWNPFLEPLWVWMSRGTIVRLDLRWRERADARSESAFSLWVASKALPVTVLSDLQRGGESLPERFLRVVLGDYSDPLGQIVDASLQIAIDQDLNKARVRAGGSPPGVRMEHRILEALRLLTREKWTMNTPGARIWLTHAGVFLSWKAAVNDILIRLRSEGETGAPQDPDTIAALLVAQGVLSANPLATGAIKHYYRLIPHVSGAPRVPIEVVKLVDPQVIGLRPESTDPIEAEFETVRADSAKASAVRAAAETLTLPLALHAAPPGSPLPNPAEAVSAVPTPQAEVPVLLPAAGGLVPEQLAQAAPGLTEGGSGSRPTEECNRAINAPEESNDHALALKRLERFGEAGRILGKLAARLLEKPSTAGLWRVDEGIAVAYPQAIVDVCETPQTFLSACESQGLLLPDNVAGGRVLRTHKACDGTASSQYVILSPRVSKYLPTPPRS